MKCIGCGLIHVDPLPPKGYLREYYDKNYEQCLYAIYKEARDLKIPTFERRFSAIRPYIKKGNLLDVGCGVGFFLEVAARHGFKAFGIEISEIAVKEARQKNIGEIQLGPFEDARYEEDFFDTVTLFDVIEHCFDPLTVIVKVGKITKPHGRLVITYPDVESIFSRIMGRYWSYFVPEEHLYYFSPITIRRLLKLGRFDIVKSFYSEKVFHLEYIFKHLKVYNPSLSKLLEPFMLLLPSFLRKGKIALYVGEKLVIAERGA